MIKFDILKPSYLWHYKFGYINKKCISKLQTDVYLDSSDFESFETYDSYLFGIMTKIPLTEKVNALMILLGLYMLMFVA